MPGLLIVNPSSGSEKPSVSELVAAAESMGVHCHVLADGDDAEAVARSTEADAIGSAGGDGSLAPIAAVAIERDLPFVCIPFGTRNHFARDLGLDRRDPIGMLAAFTGTERRIDVGAIGDRVFLNNLSIGLYADLVYRREHHRRRRAAFAGTRALWRLAGDRHRLRLHVDGDPVLARIVFIGNNRYDLSLFEIGARDTLDEGALHLYYAESWLPRHWADRVASRFVLELPSDVRAAADGEPVVLSSSRPVVIESRPGALRVLVPKMRA